MPLPHTDFWNCSKYWCACSFWARFPADCIMLCAASTGSKPCCAPFAAIFGRVGRWWGRKKRRAPGERMAGYHLCGVHVLKALSVSEVRLGRACSSGQVLLRAACEVCFGDGGEAASSHSQSRGPAHLPAKASLKCSPNESTASPPPPTTFRYHRLAHRFSSTLNRLPTPDHRFENDWTWRHVYPLTLLATAANKSQAVAEEKVCNYHLARTPRSCDANDRAVLLPPINFIFKLLQSRATISVWLYENLGMRIEGKLRVRQTGGVALRLCH